MRRALGLLLLAFSAACVVKTESVVGEQGPPGDDGTDGMDGAEGSPGQNGQDGAPGVSPFSYVDEARTTDIYYDGGKVGIGTASPFELLHVEGSEWLGSTDDTVDNPRLYVGRGVNPSEYGILEYHYAAGGGPPILALHLRDLEQFVLAADGNVGVGTLAPTATLDVNGTARLAKYSSQPFACDASHDGALALTTKHRMCVCNGTSWVQASDGLSCSWDADSFTEANYAIGAVFRDKSPMAVDGNLKALVVGATNGYEAAKSICSNQLNSPSGHMCTAEEVARSAALGIPVPNGWYIAATYAYYPPLNRPLTDCAGFATNDMGQMGHGWANGPDIYACSLQLPVLCCDR